MVFLDSLIVILTFRVDLRWVPVEDEDELASVLEPSFIKTKSRLLVVLSNESVIDSTRVL
ncbi:hypothetical protein [Mesomycoplasma ovipneumoniae]|uniref:hypothetical protein n=1 Tax=Mesomycoplasma ovipneumoniae TaxID=29562 RepID=UPI00311AF9AD